MKFRIPEKKEQLKAAGNLDVFPDRLRKAFIPYDSYCPVPEPGPYDWLSSHPEGGQTYIDFVNSAPNIPDKQRDKIFLIPLGEFPEEGSPSIEKLREYTEYYFMMHVEILSAVSIEDLAFTTRFYSGDSQILTSDILHFLMRKLPEDAFCLMGITMKDLYPDPSWNFVFGQASLKKRVGIYSFIRYDPVFYGDKRVRNYKKLLLLRSCKVLVHELCHQFGVEHCIYYHCIMNGSNHLKESDSRPIHLCPVDLRKIFYSIDFDIKGRYKKLLDFYKENGFKREYNWLKRRLEVIL